jgi:hypothetical protein
MTLAYLGHVEQARAVLGEALEEAHRRGHAYTLTYVLTRGCRMEESVTSSPHEIRHYAEQALNLSNEHGFPQWSGWTLLHLGSAFTELGQEEEGVHLLCEGLDVYRSTGAIVGTAHALTLLAQGYGKVARSAEALNCLLEAEQIIAMSDERYNEADFAQGTR